MPDWLFDLLDGVGIDVAADIWNFTMKAIAGTLTTSPQSFSPETWNLVSNQLYPWAQAIGISILNLFFMISMFRALETLHQNITLEMVIEGIVKVIIANALFLNMKYLIEQFFNIATLMTGSVFTVQAPILKVEDLSLSTALFYWMFGCLFIIVAVVCSIIMFFTVYSRYIKLYMLVVLSPFAIPALAGGHGLNHTFYAWIKTFILNCFEIVVIALTMVIGFKLIGSGMTLFNDSKLSDVFGGGVSVLNGLLTMILMTASVKGANGFLSRALGL